MSAAANLNSAEPVQAAPGVTEQAERCTTCRSSKHQEPQCFLLNPQFLADFLVRHPDQKYYWEGKVAEYKERMERKEKSHAAYLERQRVRDQKHREYIFRQVRREAKECKDAMSPGEKARRAQKGN